MHVYQIEKSDNKIRSINPEVADQKKCSHKKIYSIILSILCDPIRVIMWAK